VGLAVRAGDALVYDGAGALVGRGVA
jgi:hypothetical protein